MRKFAQALGFVALSLLVACNSGADKEKDASVETQTGSTEATTNAPETAPANQPKSYKASFSPDTAILGKSNEVLVKITGATAVALTDQDGKDEGIEFVVKLQATNRRQIGEGGNISVSYADARLQLDNGTNIAANTGTDYLRAEPESSSNIESWTFKIPAGAKPKALNLFMDGTRVSTGVSLN